ncbi:MAG: hypothetical protein ACETWR_20020 [Anaerolineae bacterium]
MKRVVVLLALTTLLLLTSVALAQTGGPYDLSWSTIDGGEATFSSGGDYSLGGTIGQPDAGLLTGGDYALVGGFWGGGASGGSSPGSQKVYLPVIMRDFP